MRLHFDFYQNFQKAAVDSIVDLFNAWPRVDNHFTLGGIVPNCPPDLLPLDEHWLLSNLIDVQQRNGLPTATRLELDDSQPLAGVNTDIGWDYPSFTVEMETGTGKTYVYLRTIYELHQKHGFSKFIIVVPSIAIYEGVIKTFEITRNHFGEHYRNQPIHLIPYDSNQLSQLRSFAGESKSAMILVMTLDAFTKASSNNLYKPTDKLSGNLLPYQFLQAAAPILILDEPQNMESATAKAALRTLHPLFALRYSATHRTSPNTVFRLTPFDALQQSLVKRITVWGVREDERYNHGLLALLNIKGSGRKATATLRTLAYVNGRAVEKDIPLKDGQNLHGQTKNPDHTDFIVDEIHSGQGFVAFKNGVVLRLANTVDPNCHATFRLQIEQTIRLHLEKQAKLAPEGIKVLSLFFIDRVGNYTDPEGVIRVLFDELYERLKHEYTGEAPGLKALPAHRVRGEYFAKKKTKTGQEQVADSLGNSKEDREAQRQAFNLIMRDKERLLSFDEPVCFIFAHSALKEGWDNPNVFQICTLNQTVSEIKKRQEIGRGLRLCVNQTGERVLDGGLNILTVIANDSYENYAKSLQQEYALSNDALPDNPVGNARETNRRRDPLFTHAEFKAFWNQLAYRMRYEFDVSSPELINACTDRLNRIAFPLPQVTIEAGEYVRTQVTISLVGVTATGAELHIAFNNTLGNPTDLTAPFAIGDDLARKTKDLRLHGLNLLRTAAGLVEFDNGVIVTPEMPYLFETERGPRPHRIVRSEGKKRYPVTFDLLARAAEETGLTRATLRAIFQALTPDRKAVLLKNPEGFAGTFIGEVKNTLANHIAARLRFIKGEKDTELHALEKLFPAEKQDLRSRIEKTGSASLYEAISADSDVERMFIQRLDADQQVLFYFKFPSAFRIQLPKVIGNYNPDWGIGRYNSKQKKVVLYLIRETKGKTDLSALRFPQEKRKIQCASAYFRALQVDYRPITAETPDWWGSMSVQQILQDLQQQEFPEG